MVVATQRGSQESFSRQTWKQWTAFFGVVVTLWVAPFSELAALESSMLSLALEAAGTNRIQLQRALDQVPAGQRAGMEFLVRHMPPVDRATLTADYLLENVALAYAGLAAAPWRDQIPDAVFLNDILPYACVNETRDASRARLQALAKTLIEGCQTPSEAAQRLNEKLFGLVKVRYSTQRRKADQSALESMESGLATCTGLSILLVDACRAVGIPARVVGTPMWANLRGNHTWVEVWDGDWNFLGAAEPDPNGLNRGWFTHDASQARRDERRHAIYASSFQPTGVTFPMVWARTIDWVNAVNVTHRYTPKAADSPAGTLRLLVKVLDRPAGRRVAATVQVTDPAESSFLLTATSRDESVDLNDILPFELKQNRPYFVAVELDGQRRTLEFAGTTNAQELLVLALEEQPDRLLASQACYYSPPVRHALGSRLQTRLEAAVADYFAASAEQQASWKFSAALEKALLENEPAVRKATWQAYQRSAAGGAQQADFATNRVRSGEHTSPYTVKTVGVQPTHGWALFIAMHGGGGVPAEVNDRQWAVMQKYYRDHPEVGGYQYLALRAPNDTWNGFYDDYVYPLIGNLVAQFIRWGAVDPNKVFLIGYSHGGYGAFAIGPKMPDRFAAIHASAAAPSEGVTTARTLRNTVFTYMIGENDTDHGRSDRCRRFNDQVQVLRGERNDLYPVVLEYQKGMGHRGLPDRDKIASMYAAVRNPVPRELSWELTDSVITDFFWIRVPTPARGQRVDVACADNRLVVTATGVTAAQVLLDSRLIDFSRPVVVELKGTTSTINLRPSLRTLCATLQRRGDPELAFSAELELFPKK